MRKYGIFVGAAGKGEKGKDVDLTFSARLFEEKDTTTEVSLLVDTDTASAR